MREIVCRRERTGSLLDSVLDIPWMVGDDGLEMPVVRNLQAGVEPIRQKTRTGWG
jgi:hypothetical protein